MTMIIKLKCIKTLYKSTYKGNAFTRNKTYEVNSTELERGFLYIIDKENHAFSFLITKNLKYQGCYLVKDYFDLNPVNVRLVIIEKTGFVNFKKYLPLMKTRNF